ncbi:hypothetical protein BDA96_03G358200 [Sorghum bicolor]|jgi:hypothetical protein|uniref:SMP domain-containing protein n=2 Tax=Sorghum bicolor TaxID=4558 RepID=A0A921RJD3_SORBI|nr:hypothetical protein BDA96_03G358200 [Sorghum bicolor]KXG33586.1 hypothetical protein SORBI_3003G331900 [Sorghum bicolor]
MGAISVCAFSLLSALLLLHCLLAPSAEDSIQSRKLLQSVLVSSDLEKARREVFQAAAKAANKVPGGGDAEVSENLKKQTPSRSNPIQN